MASKVHIVFKDNSLQVKNTIDDSLIAWLNEATKEIESKVKRESPVDTSKLKKSWNSKVDRKDKKGIIGSASENAIWNEFGTGVHSSKGLGRKSPWYVNTDAIGSKSKKPSFRGKVQVVYGRNGKKYFKTDGKPAQHTLEQSFVALKTKVKNQLKKKLRGMR